MNSKSVDKREKSYQGTIPLSEWRVLLDALRRQHWRQALESLNCPTLIQKKDWFTNSNKGLFYRHLNVHERDRFLDIGAGSGVIAHELSKLFRSGIALDYARETTHFMKIRYLQDNANNVHVVRGNGLSLPFQSNLFNLAIVNGVLEWVAYFTHGKSCRAFQLDFLREILRCLKGEGKVAIAIENRWSLGHFLGESPHGEPAYVAVMPRLMARVVNLIIRKRDYRTYIYSYFGYKRLLKVAGFSDIRAYLAVPNYYNPKSIVRVTGVNSNFASGNGKRAIIEKILSSSGLMGLFRPAFFISATKKS